MKLFPSDLTKLIQLIEKNHIKSVLFHGPNQGFIRAALEQIIKKLTCTVFSYNGQNLSINKLELITNSRNFFKQKELIKLTEISSTINSETKNFLNSYEGDNLICFIASDSLPPTGIRKYFEEAKNCAVIGCYYDNEDTIAKVILQICNKEKKNIDQDALYYLKAHLKGDNQLIKSELNKLFAYTHDKSAITKQDVIICLSSELLASGDEMCAFFACGNYAKFLQEVGKLHEQGINEVLMIRALIRYFFNLYIVSLQVENGQNLDQTIKNLSPPIFYQYINSFKQAVNKYNSTQAISVIETLQKAELSFKQNSASFDMFSLVMQMKEKE